MAGALGETGIMKRLLKVQQISLLVGNGSSVSVLLLVYFYAHYASPVLLLMQRNVHAISRVILATGAPPYLATAFIGVFFQPRRVADALRHHSSTYLFWRRLRKATHLVETRFFASFLTISICYLRFCMVETVELW